MVYACGCLASAEAGNPEAAQGRKQEELCKAASKKNSAAVAEKPEEAPKDKLFEDDEIEVVAPKAKERKAAKTGNKGSGIFTWTKKKFTDFMGDLYDGMEE